MNSTYKVPAGHTITVSATDGQVHVRQVQDSTVAAMTTGSVVFGPYMVERDFQVSGSATATVQAVTLVTSSLITSGAGAPDNAVRASASVNPTGDDNALTFTAKAYGAAGNSITVAYVNPGAVSQAIGVSVHGTNITVSLATNGGGTITSTAAAVKAAVDAHRVASALVSVAVLTSDSGTADDGTGVVTAMSRVALENGAGTGIGTVEPGGLYIDTTNADVYRNSGTKAVPAWTQLGDAA